MGGLGANECSINKMCISLGQSVGIENDLGANIELWQYGINVTGNVSVADVGGV